jgi:hypothetical protein
MDRFLAKLHKKPDHHKKRFAFLASGTVTLFIFGVWSLATFGISDVKKEVVVEKNEVGPLRSLRTNLASSLEAFRNSFGGLKTEYMEMRDNALEVYGR